jgi:hypothetical protein
VGLASTAMGFIRFPRGFPHKGIREHGGIGGM